jgi:LDH2 family malate/lactate/ureidoglycolate dehydrogenase
MTAKEKLIRDVLDLDEAKATRARIVVLDDAEADRETVPLPEGWGTMANGQPMPDVAAAVRRSREEH